VAAALDAAAADVLKLLPVTVVPDRSAGSAAGGESGLIEIELARGYRVRIGSGVKAGGAAAGAGCFRAPMIPVPSGVRVWLAVGRTDMMGWPPLANRGQGWPCLSAGDHNGREGNRRRDCQAVFQVHGVGESGMVTIRRKISRDGFLKCIS
jgi:hypothetical protein